MDEATRVEDAASSTTPQKLKDKFAQLYGTIPMIYRAPGRVNLIGEHTDYNDGFVMPAAIQLCTYAAVAPRADRKLRIYSENFDESCELDLDSNPRGRTGHWSDYVRGVAAILESRHGKLRGADLAIMGEVPLGAGLSSSASVEVAAAFALTGNSSVRLDRTEIAKICQQAEHEYAGTPCGIMDQFVSCHAAAGHALMLDCRSLDFRLLPIPDTVQLMICNTMVKHELASGEYKVRRLQCEEGVRRLAQVLPGVRALRDVSLEQLQQHAGLLDPTVYQRCRHVVAENQRVLQAATALERRNIYEFGRLMGESHRSLRDDYAVSSPELDLMVQLAGQQEGVYGARMTGGGFGGCTINLVDARCTEAIQKCIAPAYKAQTGLQPDIYICQASQAAEAITDGPV